MSPSLPFHKQLAEGNLVPKLGLRSPPVTLRAPEMEKPPGL